jgi:hypothetical protein
MGCFMKLSGSHHTEMNKLRSFLLQESTDTMNRGQKSSSTLHQKHGNIFSQPINQADLVLKAVPEEVPHFRFRIGETEHLYILLPEKQLFCFAIACLA